MSETKKELDRSKSLKKYSVVFISLVGALILSQVIIQYSIQRQDNNSNIINVAGKQRMLSQKLVKNILLVDSKIGGDRSAVGDTLNSLKEGHKYLVLKLSNRSLTNQIKRNFDNLDALLKKIESHVSCYLEECNDGNKSLNSLNQISNEFLSLMDQTVLMLDLWSKDQLTDLKWIELCLLIVVLALIFFQFFKVILPINKSLTSEILKVKKMRDDRLEELDSILSSTPSCLKIVNSSGNLLKMNSQGLHLIEADSFDVVDNASVYELIEESHREKFIEFNESVCSGISGEMTFEVIGLKGKRLWLESFSAPYPLGDGSLASISITNDISERVEEREKFERLLQDYKVEVQTSRDLLYLNEEILNSTNDGILVVDHSSKAIKKMNNRFLQMWHLSDEHSSAGEDSQLISDVLDQLEYPQQFVSLVDELYASPMKDSFDILTFKDNRIFERYSYPLTHLSEPTGRVWIFRDVTDKREMEKMLLHSSKLASIGVLAAGVGHEINNPLAIIRGYISVLNGKLTNGSVLDADFLREYLEKIDSASSRIEGIVKGLRTFARNDNGTSESFDPIETLFESLSMVEEIYERDGVFIKNQINLPKNSLRMVGSRGKLQQVFMNLLANAKDALEGVSEKQIVLDCEIVNDRLLFKFYDNGSGIPLEIQEKIFDPFFTTKDLHKGTGIGLSLVYNIVQDLNGSISFDSEQDKGTVFILDLPFDNISKVDDHSKVTQSSKDTRRFNCAALVVDDEKGIREILGAILEECGIDVIYAENGREALDTFLLNPEKFQLVISDVRMPVMDGIAFLKELRSLVNTAQPKFIFTTGGVDLDLEDKSSEINSLIDGCFYKPFDIDSIMVVLEKALGEELIN